MTNYEIAKGNVVLAAQVTGEFIKNSAIASAQETLVAVGHTAYGVAVVSEKGNNVAKKVIAHADRKMETLCNKSAALRSRFDAIIDAKRASRLSIAA